jgi:hypothetical protein
MNQCYENLIQMGSTLTKSCFSTLIMSLLPPSYFPVLQTITAAQKAASSTVAIMKPTDLITFFIEEAEHRVIEEECTKHVESALHAQGKRDKKGKGRADKGVKLKSTVVCGNPNCGKTGHTTENCWAKSRGKEGQGPCQKKSKKGEKKVDESVAVAEGEELFSFTCTSDYVVVANTLQIPKAKFGACVNSSASHHYCPDHTKFSNY